MTIPTLTTLPVAPARTDPPATFVTRADAFLAAIVTFQGEMNTSIGAMNTDIAGVNANVTAAQAAQTAAETAETNAETAETNAETAVTNAEAAETNAQTYAAAAQAAAGVPSLTGNAGKALLVNTGATGVEWAEIQTDPTKATLSQTFSANDNATLTLSTAITAGAPVVSVTKEVAQTGVTNNNWDAAAGSYTLENTAYSTTLSFETVGFDISNAVYSQSFSVASQSTNPQGVAFNTDGTKMFVIEGGAVLYEYTLTTGFDLSTTTYSQDLSVFSQDSTPRDIAFNADGTKMFLAGRSGNAIYEYTLTTGYDISTSSFVDSFSVSSQESEVEGLTFNTDGTKMFIVGAAGDEVNEYDLSTGFDISSATFSQNFSVSSEETQPFGISFNTDGTKMLIVGATGRDVGEYALTTGFDISTASFVDSFSVSSQATNPNGIAFNANGTKMFISCSDTDNVYEYTIAADNLLVLGTGSFASTDVGKTINVNDGALVLTATNGSYSETTAPTTTDTAASGEWSMLAVVYDATADVLKVSGYSEGYIAISGWSYASKSVSVGSENTSPQGLTFSSDGTRMFMVGGSTVYQYTLSTAYDISTASYDAISFAVTSQVPNARGIALNNDGSSMYIAGNNGTSPVAQYTLTTPNDLSTASYASKTFNVKTQELYPNDVIFNADGTSFYVIGSGSDTVYQYDMTTAFDVSTASYTSKTLAVSSQDSSPTALAWNADGTKLYVSGQVNDLIYEYGLTTAYDVSTASYNTASFDVSSQDTAPTSIAFADSGQNFYVLGDTNNSVFQYSTGSFSASTGYQPCISGNIDSTYWTDINSLTATNAVGDGNVFYAISNDNKTAWSILDNTDGVRDIVRDNSGTWQYNSNGTYTSETWANATTNTEVAALREAMEGASRLSNQFDISTATFVDSFSVSSQSAVPQEVKFNTDGTKMFILGSSSNFVYEYTLSTGFDVSTASYSQSFSIAGQETEALGLAFNPSGTKMFVCGNAGQDVNEYTLSTGYDVSTASFVDSFSVSGQDTSPNGIAFNSDGTKMFIAGNTGRDINEYTLSPGYDVSTSSFVDSFSVASQALHVTGVGFNSDGTQMFFTDATTIYKYTLTTGFDVSTATYSNVSFDFSAQETSGSGFAFNSDGTKLFISGYSGDAVYEYSIGSTTYTNQMDSTTLNAITDANQITLGDDLDFAAILYYASGSTVPTYSGTAINYDANVLNNGAILGTDYNFDFPASNKVRITAVNAANYKVRVV